MKVNTECQICMDINIKYIIHIIYLGLFTFTIPACVTEHYCHLHENSLCTNCSLAHHSFLLSL